MVRHVRPEAIPQVYPLSSIPVVGQREGVEGQYFRGLDTLVGVMTVEADAESNVHSHPWEQIVFILEGACEFRVADEVLTVETGDLFVVPPGYEHTVEAPEERCRLLFCGPLREDHLPHTDYQTEFTEYDPE